MRGRSVLRLETGFWSRWERASATTATWPSCVTRSQNVISLQLSERTREATSPHRLCRLSTKKTFCGMRKYIYRLWALSIKTDVLSTQGVWLICNTNWSSLSGGSAFMEGDCQHGSIQIFTNEPQDNLERNLNFLKLKTMRSFTHRKVDRCGRCWKTSTYTLMSIRLWNMCNDRRWPAEKVSLAQTRYLIC